ncbi:MAG TPA: hypothetical protein VGQ59_02680, partial [Cyclobacteriaceae bacterium]|nr:hypothetical protein [Cyclobacteriaceae bacterium]
KEISTIPINVILTGLSEHRLVTVYRSRVASKKRKVILPMTEIMMSRVKVKRRSILCQAST